MKKSEFVAAVAAKANVSKKDAETIINATFATISEEMKKDESVRIPSFGTFSSRTKAPRTAKNPRTGEFIEIPETKVSVFKAGKELKDNLNA